MKLEFFSGTLELSCGKEESFPECLEHIFKYDPVPGTTGPGDVIMLPQW